MKNLILFFLPLLVIACGSSENEAFLPEEPAYTCGDCDTAVLVGTWRLTEFYSDPGDGSGTYQVVESEKEITFSDIGTWTSNGNLCGFSPDAGPGSLGSYVPVTNDMLVANCNFDPIRGYQLQNGRFTIIYACIEGCGERYRKIRD